MSLTGIVVCGLLITAALYDLVVVCKNGVGCSVSRLFQRVGFRSPVFVFVVGALCGHFWIPMSREPTSQEIEDFLENCPQKKIAVPENTEKVTTISLDGSGLKAIFVPKDYEVRFEQTIEPIPDPISEQDPEPLFSHQ